MSHVEYFMKNKDALFKDHQRQVWGPVNRLTWEEAMYNYYSDNRKVEVVEEPSPETWNAAFEKFQPLVGEPVHRGEWEQAMRRYHHIPTPVFPKAEINEIGQKSTVAIS